MKNGILIIDKPSGWTSHDVVAKLRGVLKQKRIGHGGTLDPMATGVLPIFIGRATRAAEFAENAEKEYIAGLRFGVVTDTQDITGNIIEKQDAAVSADDLKAVLPRFLGKQKQIPPMYSAIKKDGKRLYELARQGIEVERKARDIEIKSIEVIDASKVPAIAGTAPTGDVLTRNHLRTSDSISDFYIIVVCSKGTYIRTLCHDIGQTLGCGAALSYLRRTKAGVYTIDMAHKPNDITANTNFVLPIDSIFKQYPAITLRDTDTRRAKNGALRDVRGIEDGKHRFYAPDGEFLLFGEVIKGRLAPIKSFYEV